MFLKYFEIELLLSVKNKNPGMQASFIRSLAFLMQSPGNTRALDFGRYEFERHPDPAG